MYCGIPTDQVKFGGVFVGYVVLSIIAMILYLNSNDKGELPKFLIGMFVYICIMSTIDMIRVYSTWRYNVLDFTSRPYKKNT
jgi:Na+/glutamate symporter